MELAVCLLFSTTLLPQIAEPLPFLVEQGVLVGTQEVQVGQGVMAHQVQV